MHCLKWEHAVVCYRTFCRNSNYTIIYQATHRQQVSPHRFQLTTQRPGRVCRNVGPAAANATAAPREPLLESLAPPLARLIVLDSADGLEDRPLVVLLPQRLGLPKGVRLLVTRDKLFLVTLVIV